IAGDRLDARSLKAVIGAFHRRHHAHYGYDMPGQPVEIVNLRLVVTAKRRPLPAERPVASAKGSNPRDALTERRPARFAETGFVATPVYDRDRLPAAATIKGPAIIEQMDTTTIVPPGARVKNDRAGYLHMEIDLR